MSKPRAHWLSTSQAAALLGVSERTLRRQCAAGKIPARRAGSVWQVEAGAAQPDTRADTERGQVGQKTDTVLSVNAVKSDNTDSGRAARSDTGADNTDGRFVAHLLEENRFLRFALEQRDRDAAELRAALREALKIAPRQLLASASPVESVPSSAPLDHSTQVVSRPLEGMSHEASTRDAPGTAPEQRPQRSAPMTYAEIADKLERQLNNA